MYKFDLQKGNKRVKFSRKDIVQIDRKPSIFVIGDIHGEYDMFKKLLSKHKPNKEQLVLIGDLIDKGPKSKSVLKEVLALARDEYNPAIVIKGNHEELFLDFLEYPEQSFNSYMQNGGGYTLTSLLGEDVFLMYNDNKVELANKIKEMYAEEISMLRDLPTYYSRNNLLFVHGGVNMNYEDFRNTSDEDFLWLRTRDEEFGQSGNILQYIDAYTGLKDNIKIIHGHTPDVEAPVAHLNRLNVDGGAALGGALVGVKLNIWGDITEIHKVQKSFEHRPSEF